MSLMLDDLTLTLAGRTLARLSLRVAPAQVTTIMGPSGCGKSSVLLAIAGALPPVFTLSGRVHLNGTDLLPLPAHKRRVGLLFQDDILFPHLSVAGNLGFGLPHNTPDRAARIDAALDAADLSGMGPRDPATLSGGQRARVALMRTLLSDPRALLLDEPFSKLDADLRAQMRDFVFATARAHALPVLMVTHDAEDARAAGGPVVNVMGDPVPL
jgi:putative thiamine transport system ATP-binding protein